MIVGGATLALIFLMQSIAISLGERSQQNYRLYQIGVSPRSIAWSGGLESVLDVAGGTLIALASVSIVELSLAVAFTREGLSYMYVPIQIGKFSLLAAVLMVIAFATAMFCTYWNMQRTMQGGSTK